MTTRTLHLAKNLTLPLDAVTQTFLVVGKRGSGKSNTAARFVEQLHHAKLPFVVLDPVDTWWGLKASTDGTKGLDVYVFGGSHQDLPLEPGGGTLLAEVLCEHRIPMILSVKHLSGRERSAFMVAFAQTLFQKWGGGPLHVVLEEAHEFAPQMAGSRSQNTDNESAMLGAFKRLWKLGRASGIGGTAVTQRPASLSKDITTQSEILIAHRTIGPQDVKAIGEWVKFHGEQLTMLADLPSLPTGEAFVWAPEFPEGQPIGLQRTTVLRRETFDSASTPKVGERRVEPKELAPVDLERLQKRMAATIEKAKADDPKELRRQIADLKKQLSTAPALNKSGADSTPAQVVSKPVLTDADRALLEKFTTALTQSVDHIKRTTGKELESLRADVERAMAFYLLNHEDAATKALTEIERRLDSKGFQKILDKLSAVSYQPSAPAPVRRAEGLRQPAEPRRVEPRAAAGDVKLKKGARDILNALAARHPVPMQWSQLALLCGIKSTGSTMSSYMSNLRFAGFISEMGESVSITDDGLAYAGTVPTLQSKDEILSMWSRRLKRGARAIVEDLDSIYPKWRTKTELGERVLGINAGGSTLSSYLSNLRTAGLIQERGEEVRLNEELFG